MSKPQQNEQPTAKPPVVPPPSPEAPSETPCTSPEESPSTTSKSRSDAGRVGADLKRHIFAISERVRDGRTASLLHRYASLVSPSLANSNDSRFPRTVNPHPVYPGRTIDRGFGNVLIFHVGHAVLQYYAAVGAEPDSLVEDGAIKRVADMAKLGLSTYVLWGDDAKGYEIITTEDASKR